MKDKSFDANTFEEDDLKDQEASVIHFSYGKAVSWTFIGYFWIQWAILRDSLDFWKIIFVTLDIEEEDEKTKITEIVTVELVKEF
jgi:hypothetical protein